MERRCLPESPGMLFRDGCRSQTVHGEGLSMKTTKEAR